MNEFLKFDIVFEGKLIKFLFILSLFQIKIILNLPSTVSFFTFRNLNLLLSSSPFMQFNPHTFFYSLLFFFNSADIFYLLI